MTFFVRILLRKIQRNRSFEFLLINFVASYPFGKNNTRDSYSKIISPLEEIRSN